MVRILIADDHAIVRAGLKQILADIPDMMVAGEASNGQEVLDSLRTGEWDVMLLDISMPGKNGLEVLKLARQKTPRLPVLILSMYPEDQYAVRMLRAGASGYLTKESAPDQLVAAIRKVAQGGRYINPTLAEKLAAELDSSLEKPLHAMLSDREFQIFRAIALGKTASEIATELSLSVKTVSTYRMRVMEKMHMSKNAEIIRYALKNQLLD
jgi:DNA-binding NarL/FixJ family response regulator